MCTPKAHVATSTHSYTNCTIIGPRVVQDLLKVGIKLLYDYLGEVASFRTSLQYLMTMMQKEGMQ